jgi:hypothetical protein
VASRTIPPAHRRPPPRPARRCLASAGKPVIGYGGSAGLRARLFVAPPSPSTSRSAERSRSIRMTSYERN